MRKYTILILIAFAIMIFGVIILLNKSKDVKEFCLSDYQWELETFQFEKNVGTINNANIAIEKAKDLWVEKYGVVNGEKYDPIKGRKIEAYFDQYNDCWLIKITLPPATKGSVPHAIIKKNGEVLAVWMG